MTHNKLSVWKTFLMGSDSWLVAIIELAVWQGCPVAQQTSCVSATCITSQLNAPFLILKGCCILHHCQSAIVSKRWKQSKLIMMKTKTYLPNRSGPIRIMQNKGIKISCDIFFLSMKSEKVKRIVLITASVNTNKVCLSC